MAPRFVLAAILIAFAIAVAGATITTVRQLDKQTWHASDRRLDGGNLKVSELYDEPRSRPRSHVGRPALVPT